MASKKGLKYFSKAMAIVRHAKKQNNGKLADKRLAKKTAAMLGAIRAGEYSAADSIAKEIKEGTWLVKDF